MTSAAGTADRGVGATPLATQIAFSLFSPQAGRTVPPGTRVAWGVAVAVAGAADGATAGPAGSAGTDATGGTTGAGRARSPVGGYVFDLELRKDGIDGPLANVPLAAPQPVVSLADDLAIWRRRGPNTSQPGMLLGAGDAFAVPWKADYLTHGAVYGTAAPTDAATVTTADAATAAAAGTATTADGSVTMTTGAIDTTGLPPGRYVLILRPLGAVVLRTDVDLTADHPGNFARPATIGAPPSAITFDLR